MTCFNGSTVIIDQHFISPIDEDENNNSDAYESSMRYATATNTNPLFIKKSRKERALLRRGAFYWLPFYCSNDLKHGSWWFLWASLLATFIPVVPLINLFVPFWATTITMSTPGTLPLLQNVETYSMLICSGILCTLGSLVFVRAAEEPPLRPLLSSLTSHFATDELLAAWLFFLSSIPLVPFMAVYVYYNHKVIVYWAILVASIVFSFATFLFVLSCYPSDYNNPHSINTHSHSKSQSYSYQSHLYSKIKSIAITSSKYRILSSSAYPSYDSDKQYSKSVEHNTSYHQGYYYSSIGGNENDTLIEDYIDDDGDNNNILNENQIEKQQHQEYQQQRQIIPKLFTSIFGEREWIRIHCCNDWLAAMWIFLYVTLFMMIGSLIMAITSLHAVDKNQLEVYDWWSSTIDCFMFLIGSAYMCAGSYPQQNVRHQNQSDAKHNNNNNNINAQLLFNNDNSSINKSEYAYNYLYSSSVKVDEILSTDQTECTTNNHNKSLHQPSIYKTIATITPQTATTLVTKSATTTVSSLPFNSKYIARPRQLENTQPKEQVKSLLSTTQSIRNDYVNEKAPLLG